MSFTRASTLLSLVDAIPVAVKSFVAAAILLVCMVTIGTNGYLTSMRTATGLGLLNSEVNPKRRAFGDLAYHVTATQIKIFRFFAVWSGLKRPQAGELRSSFPAMR
jgi:hypothetical protein